MREGARTRVALYCRLSEEDRGKQRAEEDSGSIANQKAMLRDYANDRGGRSAAFTVMTTIPDRTAIDQPSDG